MERPSRSLRRLPGRLTDDEPSFSRSSPTKKSGSPKKGVSPSRKLKEKEKKSPQRRSRSRSLGRPKKIIKEVEINKVSPPKSVNSKKKSASPSKGVVSRVKDSVEKFTKSLSPDVEDLVRRSVSRLEEVKNDVLKRSLTPRTVQTLTRSKLRSTTISNNLQVTQDVDLIEEEEDGFVKNHVSFKKSSGEGTAVAAGPGSDHRLLVGRLLVVGLFKGLVVLLLAAATLVAHALCTRDDCRLVTPNPQKLLNSKLYFDSYTWLGVSLASLLLFLSHRFLHLRIKRAPYISPIAPGPPSRFVLLGLPSPDNEAIDFESAWLLKKFVRRIGLYSSCILDISSGIGWLVVGVSALAGCHYYTGGLRLLKPLPLAAAALFHVLVLSALSSSSLYLLSVNLSTLVHRLSAVLALVLLGWIGAGESVRAHPNSAVYILAGLQALQAADSLLFEPMINWTSPLSIGLFPLRPLLLALLPVYISANNIHVEMSLLVAVISLSLIGHLLYRHSLLTKAKYLADSHTHRHTKLTEYSEGAWQVVRQPQLTGRLLMDLGLAASTAPSPLGLLFAGLAFISAFLESRNDSSLLSSYRAPDRSLLIPYVY